MSSGAPIGTHIGTESELMSRFRVSRDPLREAIRILEWQGLVVASRGRRGGGLRVLASPSAAMAGMLRTYLQLSDISLGEVLESIGILQRLLLEEVTLGATKGEIQQIREMISQARSRFLGGAIDIPMIVSISEKINSAASNPAARIFLDALRETSVDFTHARRQPRLPRGDTSALTYFTTIIDAVEARDARAVIAAHDLFLRGTAERHSSLERQNSKIWNTHSFLLGDYTEALRHIAGRQKRAARMAYDLAAFIRRKGLAAGTRVSSQSDVIERHAASRSVLREAMRLLEFFGVVEVRRGKDGGLRVIAPNPASILDFAEIYFRHTVTERKGLSVIREHLDGAATELCATKLSTAGVLAIRAKAEVMAGSLSAEGAASAACDISNLIYELSDNRCLLLFGQVLSRVSAQMSKGFTRISRPARLQERVMECIARLSTAYLKANEPDILDSLNTLRRLISPLCST